MLRVTSQHITSWNKDDSKVFRKELSGGKLLFGTISPALSKAEEGMSEQQWFVSVLGPAERETMEQSPLCVLIDGDSSYTAGWWCRAEGSC